MSKTIGNSFKLHVTASSGWTPEYQVPTAPGQVVIIAGRAPDASVPYVSTWPTNCASDVRPAEQGSGTWNVAIVEESTPRWIGSYSLGGAIVTAGTGGHRGEPNYGAWLFDFTDARHKRIWTGGIAGETGVQDVRAGTRVHNILHHQGGEIGPTPVHQGDVIDKYTATTTGYPGEGTNWNPDSWIPSGGQLARCPRTPDPRDQIWECTHTEPYPYSATVVNHPVSGTAPPTSGPRGWPYPGEWAGLQGCADRGLVGRSFRFDPQPWPSTIPIPAHCWDMFFELSTAHGGGPKGTIVSCRHAAAGLTGTSGTVNSYGFNLATGLWSKISVNAGDGFGPAPLPLKIQIPAAAATDPVMQRVYLPPQSPNGSAARIINYLNLSDRIWRGLQLGATPTPTNDGRVDNYTIDPDRRLLFCTNAIGFHNNRSTKAFDLASIGTAAIPSPAPVGWRPLPVIFAPGFTPDWYIFSQQSGTEVDNYEANWVYYPPNGKFYRSTGKTWGVNLPTPSPAGTFQKLYRLTPPSIIPSPPANYYFDNPWVMDEIALSQPMANQSAARFRWPKRLFYIPTLQCLTWIPLDSTLSPDPVTLNPVYLIKPY